MVSFLNVIKKGKRRFAISARISGILVLTGHAHAPAERHNMVPPLLPFPLLCPGFKNVYTATMCVSAPSFRYSGALPGTCIVSP